MKKIFLGLVILVLLLGGYAYWSLSNGTPLGQLVAGAYVAQTHETLETRLQTYFTEVHGQQRLQVAKLEQMEKLSRTSRRKVLWKRLELPSVVVSIEVPVTYIYNIDLKKDWSIQPLEAGQRGYRVLAPPLEWNRPAADVSAMRILVEKSSVFRNEDEVSTKLISELSGYLEERSAKNVHLVREHARLEIKNLLEKWLTGQAEGRVPIQVLFPGENSENFDSVSGPVAE